MFNLILENIVSSSIKQFEVESEQKCLYGYIFDGEVACAQALDVDKLFFYFVS